ncbi:MAG TPA: hypothetical protein DCM86_17195, partial [Verrucomicrobiales bacterium]|nr:hypothetical protein [Verrucomicrobiales bacterium]
GVSDSLFDFYVDKEGYYMMRLDWWQGVGAAAVKVFSVDPCTGDQILINDRKDPRAVPAYWIGKGPAFCRSVAPALGQLEVEVQAPIVFTLVDDGTPVDPASIQITLAQAGTTAVAQNFTLSKSGLITTATVAPPAGGWLPATIYFGSLTFNGGSPGVYAFRTTLTPPGTFFIEAEDYNSLGKANPKAGVPGLDVNKMPYYGGAYDGLAALDGIDEHVVLDVTGIWDLYRPGETRNRPLIPNTDMDLGFRGYYFARTSYRAGYMAGEDFMNFTRVLPAARYRVYAALSSADTVAGFMGGTLYRVTSDPALAPQQITPLGYFNGPLSGVWGLNNLVPMTDANQGVAVINTDNGGTYTLRFTAGSGDFDYLALVPLILQPSISSSPDQVTDEDTPTKAIPFTVSDPDTAPNSLTLSATCSDPALVFPAGFVFAGSGNARTLVITPAPNASGSATIVVTVTDPQGGRSVTHFQLTVNPVNDPPFLGTIPDQTVNEDTSSGEITVKIGDIDTPDAQLTISAKCNDPALIPDTGFVFTTLQGARSFHFTPAPNAYGTNTVTVTVSDGFLSAQRTFTVRVVAQPDPPVISTIADITLAEGATSAPLPFTIGDPDTPAVLLTLVASTSNPNSIPLANITFGGSGTSRTVQVIALPGVTGPVVVGVLVSDGQLTASTRFTVTVVAVPKFDWGDAPDSYHTTQKNNGAVHRILPGFQLGQFVDAEGDGQPDPAAKGDDANPPGAVGDEDGVHFASHIYVGFPTQIIVDGPVANAASGRLDAWIDWNADGDFDDPGEWVIVHGQLAGSTTFNIPVPQGATLGATFARFRLTREGINLPYGPAPDGEVEDYQIRLEQLALDFGDAPEDGTSYPTRLARDGARHSVVSGLGSVTHVVPRLYLGRFVDTEPDGQPNATATGDDLAGPVNLSDEDGVRFLTPLYAGGSATIEVVSSDAGYLDGWIDYNHDGSWKEPQDTLFKVSATLVAGTNRFSFVVPAAASPGATFARFRASRVGGLSYTGFGGEGEVEDYKVAIRPTPRCDYTCAGNDFWITVPGNYAPDPANPPVVTLCMLGASGTTGSVEIPGLSFTAPFTIPAGGVLAQVTVPAQADLGSLNDAIAQRGIHVRSSGDISLQAINSVTNTTDGFLAIPVETLGTEYLVQAYRNVNAGRPRLNGSQFAIVATAPDTDVTITPSVRVGSRFAGVPYTIRLQPGEVYQLRNTNDVPGDVTGTEIRSTDPVGVFGGHRCANINGPSTFFCDYVVEQLLPVRDFGVVHPVYPLAGRSGGDTVRMLGAYPNTHVFLDGVAVATLQRGQVYEQVVAGGGLITSDQPISVAQFANSSDFDGVDNADPFMVNVLPSTLYTRGHVVCTGPARFSSHYINIIVPDPTARGVTQLDGALIPVASWHQIGTSSYWGVSLPVGQGPHAVISRFPVSVLVYGWAPADSYGWTGCIGFGDIIPPVLIPPPDITLSAGVGFVTGAANIPPCTTLMPNLTQAVQASDNCSALEGLTVTQDPAPGTILAPGTYTVTFTTRDQRGNVGTSTMTITVTEPSPLPAPVLHCPTNIVTKCQNSTGAIVRYDAFATQLCRTPVSLVCDPPSGSLFPVGVTTVTCTLPDPVNPQTCTFTVTVECQGGPLHTLDVSYEKGVVVLRWPATVPGTLQTGPTVLGPWTPIPGATSPFQIPVKNQGIQFFRLIPLQ